MRLFKSHLNYGTKTYIKHHKKPNDLIVFYIRNYGWGEAIRSPAESGIMQ